MGRPHGIETAVFGGSFDPPHCAHVMAVAYALACTPCEEAWVVPCFSHPFGKRSASFADRLAMCEAAFEPMGPRVKVLDVEARLPAPSYTVRTLEKLAEDHPGRRLRLVVGTDVMPETPGWRDFDRVKTLAPLLILRRAGAPEHPDAVGPQFPDVSSTEIRRILASGGDVTGLVPTGAFRVIRERGLYAG